MACALRGPVGGAPLAEIGAMDPEFDVVVTEGLL
jgi:hypothetical protein